MKYNVFILDNKVNFNNYAQSLTYISVIKDCRTQDITYLHTIPLPNSFLNPIF